MRTEIITFMDHEATVIIPDCPNGKWIWKTEFLYAFDLAETELCKRGYTRVYFSAKNRYGSPSVVRLMHAFHLFVTEKYGLEKKAVLFGFSRGGLYAFNYALSYPEYVDKVYLDAPVLDMKSWPPANSKEREQVYAEFCLTESTLALYRENPVDNLSEFFCHGIPLMLVAGDADELVPLLENGQILLDYAESHGHKVTSIIKSGCGHHPHSLEDVAPIIDFVMN